MRENKKNVPGSPKMTGKGKRPEFRNYKITILKEFQISNALQDEVFKGIFEQLELNASGRCQQFPPFFFPGILGDPGVARKKKLGNREISEA